MRSSVVFDSLPVDSSFVPCVAFPALEKERHDEIESEKERAREREGDEKRGCLRSFATLYSHNPKAYDGRVNVIIIILLQFAQITCF